MGTFEYLLLFITVILGLAVSDLAVSLHRLLSAGDRVRWDWLSPLAAVVAFLKILTLWWTWHASATMADAVTFGMFLTLSAASVTLFLMAAAALPDEVPHGETVDLRRHAEQVRRRYWVLFLVSWVLINLASAWLQVAAVNARFDPLQPAYLLGLPMVSGILICNRRWQAALLFTFAAVYLTQIFGQRLT